SGDRRYPRRRDFRPVPATGPRRDERWGLDRSRRPPRSRNRDIRPLSRGAAKSRPPTEMTTARFDLLLDDVHAATMSDASGYAAIRDAAIGIRGDRIAWIGPASELPRSALATRRVDCGGRWATAGLLDCHTHLVYAGNRAEEFEQRRHGASYGGL